MLPIMNVPFPSFPFPLFPSLIPCQKQSVALVTHPIPLLSKSVHPLPSSSLPPVPCPLSLLTIMFPPSFPIDDYVPALFPYFRLCSFSLSLFLIMFLMISVPDVLMLLLQDCWKCNLCIKYLSKQTGQLLFMHRIMFQISTLFLVQKSPLKKWVLEPS